MKFHAALQVLELRKIEEPGELHRAYRRLVKRWHPDQFIHQPEKHAQAEERLKQINQAYSALNQYLQQSTSSTCHADQTTDRVKSCGSRSAPLRSGFYQRWKQWFRETLSKACINGDSEPRPDASGRPYRSTRKTFRSSFEQILRQTQSGNTTRSLRKPRRNRRTTPIVRYRKRSGGARINGTRPVSPVTPIRPVSPISPIEGSD